MTANRQHGDDSVRRRTRLTSAEVSGIPFNLSHEYLDINAIIVQQLRRTLPVNLHEAFRGASLKLKPSVGAAQHQYIVLNEEILPR
jgi:hypothetical protein